MKEVEESRMQEEMQKEEQDVIAAIMKMDIQKGEALVRLRQQKDFQEVFNDGYVKDYALTQQMLMKGHDTAQRQKAMEGIIARSHFVDYQEQVLENYEKAKEYISM